MSDARRASATTANRPGGNVRTRAARVVTRAAPLALLATLAFAAPPSLGAQPPAPARDATDSLVTVRIRVLADSFPVVGATVRAGRAGALTNDAGEAALRLSAGEHLLVVARIGFRADTTRLLLAAGRDTSLVVRLAESEATLARVVVSATRSERRVEDSPVRVEVIEEEEIAEKVAMTPGDIGMMLNETSGLRVQATNPSLGGAGVRVQGLRGRYALILADGLPLHGQSAGLGLLQIPPLDLGRVEVIKGTASALYGSAALGGVVNLVSRRPGAAHERTALVNRTSRGGTDGVFFGMGPLGDRLGYSLLAGAHGQRRNDIDGDGWTDMPGYERLVLRPRLHYHDGAGRTAFLTAGFTGESREGGTLAGRSVPGGGAFAEGLRTRRVDVGGLARWVLSSDGAGSALRGAILTLRGSAMEQRHRHALGDVRERDRHRTLFGEAALAVPRGRVTWVAGAALQRDVYRNGDLPAFDYTHTAPAAFAQADVDPASWLSLSASARLDAHDVFGTVVNPRVSALLRRPASGALADWTVRVSGGTGSFVPTPFTEETEATGLTPLAALTGLATERARSLSLDVGGPLETALGLLELNATAFGSRVARPLLVVDAPGVTADGATRIALVNAPAPTRTWGGELLARLVRELGRADDPGRGAHDEEGEDVADDDVHHEPPALRITATWTYLRSRECDPETLAAAASACARREVPLTPRHAAGLVAAVEQHDVGRIGIEVYYTGRQRLEENPYRAESEPYVVVGVLGERAVATPAGVARLFLNLENLTDVRQTRTDPLLRPTRGPGGRWTTDAWTDLAGFTVNGGIRFAF